MHKKLKICINSQVIIEKIVYGQQFNQEAWLKPCTDMNIKLRKIQKKVFQKRFFQVDE